MEKSTRRGPEMRLVKIWETDLEKAFVLQNSFQKNNGAVICREDEKSTIPES